MQKEEYNLENSDFLIFLYSDVTDIIITPLEANNKYVQSYSLNELLLNAGNYFRMMTSPLFQAMGKDTVEQNIFEFTTGYLTQDKKFYKAPIEIGNVILSSLRVSNRNNEGHSSEIKISLDVYDKYYNRRTIVIEDETENIIEATRNIVNRLNFAVSQGYRVKYLNESLIKLLYKATLPFETDLKSIEYRLFENSGANRPGKDNSFWDEIEIKNLPKSKYLVFLIRESLSLDNSIDLLDEDTIIIRRNVVNAFCSPIGRRQIADNHTIDSIKKRIDDYVSDNYNIQAKRLSFLFFCDRIFYSRHNFRINSSEIENEMLNIINRMSIPFDRYELLRGRKLTDIQLTSVEVRDHSFDRLIHLLIGKAHVSFGIGFDISTDYIMSFELAYNFQLKKVVYIHHLEIDDWAKDYTDD